MAALLSVLVSLLSVVAAVVPTAAYVFLIWRIDRYEKEPLKLAAAAFLWGALPAVVASAAVELAVDAPLTALFREYSKLLSASLIAPPVEELLKSLALLCIFLLARYEFDGVLDGIIYGSLIGFGFAMTENVLYFWEAQRQSDALAWVGIILGRAIAFGFNHAMFTSLAGVGFGLARYAKSARSRGALILTGFLAATAAHFLHNSFLSIGDLCVISFIADWMGVSVVFVIVLLAWHRERRWIGMYLPEEVALGTLTPAQFASVTSRRERLKRTWLSPGSSGSQARLWRSLLAATSELAFKKHQQAAMGEEKGNAVAITALRAKILSIRRLLGNADVPDDNRGPDYGEPASSDAARASAPGVDL